MTCSPTPGAAGVTVKSAVAGAYQGMERAGRRVPVITQVTVETTGQMLLGSDIAAALTAIEHLGVDVIGMNCATGPAEMGEHLRYLAQHARTPLSCLPNAGLPELRDGKPWYPLTPTELAEAQETIETVLAGPQDASLLGVDVGFPLLLTSRHSFDADGSPVEWAQSWYRGDRYKLVTRLRRPGP